MHDVNIFVLVKNPSTKIEEALHFGKVKWNLLYANLLSHPNNYILE